MDSKKIAEPGPSNIKKSTNDDKESSSNNNENDKKNDRLKRLQQLRMRQVIFLDDPFYKKIQNF
jgi:hypothetical protein